MLRIVSYHEKDEHQLGLKELLKELLLMIVSHIFVLNSISNNCVKESLINLALQFTGTYKMS